MGPSYGKVGMHAYVTKEEGSMGRTRRQVEGRNVCIYLLAGMDEMLSLDRLLGCRWTPTEGGFLRHSFKQCTI